MVIMALDHTRDFLDSWSRTNSPTNLAVTTPGLFFTRWITHFCAPAFVFLAGTSIAIQFARSTDLRATRSWLLRRGLILIAVEFTLMNFGFSFDPKFRVLIFEVIGTIGAGMILLSFLSRLSIRWLLPITAIIFFGHDLLPFPPPMAMTARNASLTLPILKALAWTPGNFQVTPNLLVLIAYPILPWLGILLTGFIVARWFERPVPGKKTTLPSYRPDCPRSLHPPAQHQQLWRPRPLVDPEGSSLHCPLLSERHQISTLPGLQPPHPRRPVPYPRRRGAKLDADVRQRRIPHLPRSTVARHSSTSSSIFT